MTRPNTAAAVIVLASTAVFGRLLFEVGVVAPGALPEIAPPLAAMMGLMAALSWAISARKRAAFAAPEDRQPPSTLKSAILFGLLYAVVLLAVATARHHLNEEALYAVAALSGLTDMDAITLSTVRLIESGRLEAAVGWRIILVGALSNLAFKGGIVVFLGGGALFRRILPYFAAAAAGGALLLALWPDASGG